MGEMKKFTVENVPVDELPEIVRRKIEGGNPARVSITVEFEAADQSTAPRRSLRSFIGSAPGLYESPEEVVDYIRNLRDESDR